MATNVQWQVNLRSYFKELNILEENQFNVYYELLTSGNDRGLKASEVTERVGLNRTYVYNVLNVLREKGLVMIMPGSPTLYVANNPSQFIDHQIIKVKDQLERLKEFKAFVDVIVNPQLDELRKMSSSPLKEVYTIDNVRTLSLWLREVISSTTRVFMLRLPSNILENIVTDLDERIREVHADSGPQKRCQVTIVTERREILPEDLKKFALPTSTITDVQIVLDQTVFLFNIRSESFQNVSGMGLMIKDPAIARSYVNQLENSFKEILYFGYASNSLDHLSPSMRSDHSFVNGLEMLLRNEWHINQFESEPEMGYVELIAPGKPEFLAFKEAGIRYEPKPNGVMQKDIDRSFRFMRQNVEGSLRYEVENDILEVEFEEATQTYGSFHCRVLVNEVRLRPRLLGSGRKEPQYLNSGRSVVFSYYDRAVVSVWAVNDQNIPTILKALEEQ